MKPLVEYRLAAKRDDGRIAAVFVELSGEPREAALLDSFGESP